MADAVTGGALIVVRDAGGRVFRKRALGPPRAGHNFEVVWLCSEQEWEAAAMDGGPPEGEPWPVEDVIEVIHHAW